MAVKKKTVSKNSAVKPKRGRPTKYDPSFCEIALDALSKGFSKEAVAGHLGIAKDTLYQWEKEHKDFSDSLKQGVELSRLFWEKIAIDNLVYNPKGKQLSATTWIFNMKNRFGWTDKKEVELGEKSLEAVKLSYSIEEDDDPENE